MRREDVDRLNQPYKESRLELDRRFHSALGADVPCAGELATELFRDLDIRSFGVSWWTSLPSEERILISDYLYQCVTGIELNLVEAKLHYIEWQEAVEKIDDRIVNMVTITSTGHFKQKHPPSLKPMDDLPTALEKLHVCGFFRAIGSSLDCLGAAIIGVLGLRAPLRKSDIGIARNAVNQVTDSGTPGSRLQLDFQKFFQTIITDSGPKDWFDWTSQYRNMFVHRGRRIMYNSLADRGVVLFDSREEPIVRVRSILHLAKYPDRSDTEAMILGKDIVLNEGAEVTLPGIFSSCRTLLEAVSEKLVSIWQERRRNPALLVQPIEQWKTTAKPCAFVGYKPNSPPLEPDTIMANPILTRRLLAASLDDAHRGMWAGTKWNQ